MRQARGSMHACGERLVVEVVAELVVAADRGSSGGGGGDLAELHEVAGGGDLAELHEVAVVADLVVAELVVVAELLGGARHAAVSGSWCGGRGPAVVAVLPAPSSRWSPIAAAAVVTSLSSPRSAPPTKCPGRPDIGRPPGHGELR
jgi:hypothetical protein